MSVSRENKKIRVLIVDDIQETRDNLKKLLYFEDDIEIIGAASNGREGVDQANELKPDIVLMDINMPGMDGIQASELISQQDPNIQVVMMSVQGEADYLRRSMLAGAREFLIKPFSSEELANSLRRVYQLAATRRVIVQQAAPPPPLLTANTYRSRRANRAALKSLLSFRPKAVSAFQPSRSIWRWHSKKPQVRALPWLIPVCNLEILAYCSICPQTVQW